MTLLFGILDNDGEVYLASDSCASDGNETIESYGNEKVFRNGDFVMGVTGSFRIMNILKYIFVHRSYDEEEWDSSFDYMVRSFVPSLMKCLRSNKALIDDKFVKSMDSSILVGFKNNLFVIDTDFHVGTYSWTKFICVGTAAPAAQGALMTCFYENKDVMESIDYGINASLTFSKTVKGPFHVINTLNFQIETL
jgi:hypothetical protein